MHELSIALNILDIAQQESDRRGGARVVAIHVRLGPLSGVVHETLRWAFELAREGSSLADCRLEIEQVPIVVYCPACRTRRPVESSQWMVCAHCGTPSAHVLNGRELEVAALEIVDAPRQENASLAEGGTGAP